MKETRINPQTGEPEIWVEYYKPSIGKTVGYWRKDVGARGKGKKVLPPIKYAGAMNAVAKEMGYSSVTAIPKDKIPEYCKRLVERYGAQRAFGMAHRQVIYRKRRKPEEVDGTSLAKFVAIRDYIRTHYRWEWVDGTVTKLRMPKDIERV